MVQKAWHMVLLSLCLVYVLVSPWSSRKNSFTLDSLKGIRSEESRKVLFSCCWRLCPAVTPPSLGRQVAARRGGTVTWQSSLLWPPPARGSGMSCGFVGQCTLLLDKTSPGLWPRKKHCEARWGMPPGTQDSLLGRNGVRSVKLQEFSSIEEAAV